MIWPILLSFTSPFPDHDHNRDSKIVALRWTSPIKISVVVFEVEWNAIEVLLVNAGKGVNKDNLQIPLAGRKECKIE